MFIISKSSLQEFEFNQDWYFLFFYGLNLLQEIIVILKEAFFTLMETGNP